MSTRRTPAAEIQAVGRVLVSALARDISTNCQNALQQMADTGVPLQQNFIEELHRSKEFVQCLAKMPLARLAELRSAVGNAASSSIANMEIMGLWSFVHAATKELLPDTLDLQPLQEATTKVIADGIVDVKESAASIGRLLLAAFHSSMALSATASVELQDAVKEMVGQGTPLAASMVDELKSHAQLVSQALPKDKLLELQALCSHAIPSEWGELKQFASQLQESINHVADSPLVGMVQQGVIDVYNSPLTRLIVQEGFANLDKAFTESRESLDAAMTAIVNGVGVGACTSFLATLPPLLRFEILRDFCQTVSLFFTNLYGTILDNQDSPIVRNIQAVFRAIYDIVSANFSAIWSNKREQLIDFGYILLLVCICIGYVCFLWFAFMGRHLHKRSDEVRHGHEGTTWAQLAATQQTRVKVFTYVITGCLTIYLPLTRLSVEILIAAIVKKPATENNGKPNMLSTNLIKERYGDLKIWSLLEFLAVVLLVTFTIPLPLLLMRAIKENRPTGSLENPLVTYDLDGEEVPFDDKVYARLIANDPAQLRCPYRSLYAGFESKWSFYKVFQLLFKVALILPLITVQQLGIRGAISCAIYLLIVTLTSYGTPFSDPLNNFMEVSGKITALVTCIGGMILAFGVSSKLESIIGAIVNIVNLVNLVVMLGVMLFSMKKTRQFIKNWLGMLTFSDTVRDILDGPSAQIIPQWDLDREIKHRVWHAFWKTILLSFKNNELVQRLHALEQAVVASGMQNIKRHWEGQRNEYVAQMRMAARTMLEGVDVYWNNSTGARDGHLDSQTCFGKMYITPYPFHCVMVYDDAKDEAIIRDDKFSEFLFLNFSPAIVEKRLLRQKLRALGATGVQIYFSFTRQEHVTVEDGTITRTTTDAQGNSHTHTETRHTNVEFTCHYTMGVITVDANSKDRAMADGFLVSMTYRDGYGDAVAPHTGVVHHQTNRVAVMGPEHIGLTAAMQDSRQLQHIFAQTQVHWAPALAELQNMHCVYRQQLIEKHNETNNVLGDGFWYFVYNNPTLDRAALERYLTTEEQNPLLRALPQTQPAALSFLYKRVAFVQSHRAAGFWFLFWDDVFVCNGAMSRLQPFKADLDPLESTSICYRVVKRDELERWLAERRLRGKPLGVLTVLLMRKTLFHDKLLTLLYEQLHRHTHPHECAVGGDSKGAPQATNARRVVPWTTALETPS